MLEKACIQSRGFRNVKSHGKIIGFQINIDPFIIEVSGFLSYARPRLQSMGKHFRAIKLLGRLMVLLIRKLKWLNSEMFTGVS